MAIHVEACNAKSTPNTACFHPSTSKTTAPEWSSRTSVNPRKAPCYMCTLQKHEKKRHPSAMVKRKCEEKISIPRYTPQVTVGVSPKIGTISAELKARLKAHIAIQMEIEERDRHPTPYHKHQLGCACWERPKYCHQEGATCYASPSYAQKNVPISRHTVPPAKNPAPVRRALDTGEGR